MKTLIGISAATGLAVAGAGAAHAEVSVNAAVTSNYVWRGVTQSDSGPAIQAGVDYSTDIAYVGAWASSVDFGGPGTTEIDLFAGVTPSVGIVDFDFSVYGYFYPQADDSGAESDFFEFAAAASIEVAEPLVIGAAFYYSPEFYGETGDATYVEVNGAYAFTDKFALSAAYGSQDVDALGDYATWNLGGTLTLDAWAFDLRYHDVDISGADSEISFTISRAI